MAMSIASGVTVVVVTVAVPVVPLVVSVLVVAFAALLMSSAAHDTAMSLWTTCRSVVLLVNLCHCVQ